MEELTPEPVLIAGAGPVGLALAVGLARYGVPAIVFEKKAELSPHSRALLITTRTLEVFRDWGVLERFVSTASVISKLSLHLVGRRAPVVTFDFTSLATIATIRGAMILSQNRTEAVLLEAARASGVAVHFAHELTGFSQDPAGVTIRVNSQGESKQFRGSYLVGCDGAHSTVREQFGWPLEGKTYPSRIMLADVRLPDERGDVPFPRLAPQRRGVLASIRFESRTWRIISTVDPEEADEVALRPENIAKKVNRLFGPGPYEDIWSSVFRIHCRTSPRFQQGRVILAGDAAHLNSPAGGQGMNAGIHDAHNLAWKLARALRGGNAEALLTSYEQERREAVVSTVERFTDLLTRMAFLPSPQLRAFVLWIVRSALGWPAIRAQILPRFAMLNTRYRRSRLLNRQCLYVGMRAPDTELENAGGVRRPLYTVAALKAVLILFDDRRMPGWDTAAFQEALAGIPDLEVVRLLPPEAVPRESDEWRDIHGTLWKAWHGSGDLAVLIRPDSHVGWSWRRPSRQELSEGVRRALGAG